MIKKSLSLLATTFLLFTPIVPAQMQQIEVVATFEADPEIFTQGLEYYNGLLYQSSGLYNKSFLRAWDPETREIINQVEISPEIFAEGITILHDELYMITWQENVCIVYDPETLTEKRRHYYEGQGWGLANNGSEIIMSNGTSEIVFRDPLDFSVTRTIQVMHRDQQVNNLNELEYHDGYIYANIFTRDVLLIIDPDDGETEIAISFPVDNLFTNRSNEQVLNGIAWNPYREQFLITGKHFPRFFLVDLSRIPLPDKSLETNPSGLKIPAATPVSPESRPMNTKD